MGRSSRTLAEENYKTLASKGYKIAGQIKAPGTLEGGDFIWIDDSHAAVDLDHGLMQGNSSIKRNTGTSVELHVVDLPDPIHPEDVLHLMSIISP